MRIYRVWDQQVPVTVVDIVSEPGGGRVKLFAANLVERGTVEARDASHAIMVARIFRLSLAPMVQELRP